MDSDLRLKVRLTRKLANTLNGIDLTQFQEGECVELPPSHARILILEGWAEIHDPAPVESPIDPSAAPCVDERSAHEPEAEPEHEPY